MMSNSACLNGGDTLFLTTLTRVRDPTTSVQLYNELAETGDYDLMITSSRTAPG